MPRKSCAPITRRVTFEKTKTGWKKPFDSDKMKNAKPTFDLIDAKTGDVVHEGGKKLTPRQAKKLAEDGLTHLAAVDEDLYGTFIAEDLIDLKTGEIFVEAGDELDEKLLTKLKDKGFDELPILDIDHVTVGAYLRNTLAVDKNESREDALFDIYRVMRPGEPPTVETAEAMFKSLFFDSERYDLSAPLAASR